MSFCIFKSKIHILFYFPKSYFLSSSTSWWNQRVHKSDNFESEGSPPPPLPPVLLLFSVFINKGADESLQIRMGAPHLKLHANKWICSPSRQPLIVFHRGKMQFVSFLCRTSEGRWLTAPKKTLWSQSKKIRSVLCSCVSFYISICLIRLWAVTVNGCTSQGKNRWHGPSVGG